jgi:hypothetical protein
LNEKLDSKMQVVHGRTYAASMLVECAFIGQGQRCFSHNLAARLVTNCALDVIRPHQENYVFVKWKPI